MSAASGPSVPIPLLPVPRRDGDARIELRLEAGTQRRLQSRDRPAGYRLPLAGAVLAVLALSIVMIPRGQEEALLRLEAGDLEGARAVLERRHAEGERSPALVAALARTRERMGDLAGAAALLEPLALQRPREAEIVAALVAVQRQLGGDRAGLLRALLMQQALAPSAERLREIAGLHGLLGDTARQRQALHALVADGSLEPGDHLALARLEAAAGVPATAITLVRRMAGLMPQAMDLDAAALLVALHVQAGEPEAAVTAAATWLAPRDPEEARRGAPVLASFLGAAGRPDLAMRLLEPLATPSAPVALLLALAQAEIDAGHEAAALARLERLPPGAGAEAVMLRLRLALALGAPARAMDALDRLPPGAVAPHLVVALARAAVDAAEAGTLARLFAWGGPDLLADDAPLAVEVAWVLGDDAAARRWSVAARAAPDPADPRRVIGFAGALGRLGEADRAAALLMRLLARPDLPPALTPEIARAFLRLDRAEQGVAALGARRSPDAPAMVHGAWILLAAGTPAREAEVVAWLQAMAGPEPFGQFLRDVLHVASAHRAPSAAVAAAEQLLARSGADADRLLLGQLLIAAHRPVAALDVLRPVRTADAAALALYEAALRDALLAGDPGARAELTTIWSARLDAATTDAERDTARAILAELGAHRALLPLLRRLAAQEPERWLWAYTEAADRADQRREATALWGDLARQPQLRPELRRQLGFGLLERGARREADAAFRLLAAAAPPDSPDTRQLLFVWGARPDASALGWLGERARAAQGAEKAAWMRLLIERGGTRQAIAAYAGEPAGPVRDAYLEAVSGTNDRPRLAATVREELGRTTSVEGLQALAVMAGQSGDAALEERVLRALVLAGGGSAEARRRVGLAAFRQGELDFAERLLTEHAAGTAGDAETFFVLGEIRLRRGDAEGARRQHEAALRRIPAETAERRELRAVLLRRLGRNREAAPIYATLVAERPGDRNLRADYVALLIDLRDYREAQTVLAGR